MRKKICDMKGGEHAFLANPLVLKSTFKANLGDKSEIVIAIYFYLNDTIM